MKGLVGCGENDNSLPECGRDMSERSLPQLKQCWTQWGFLWPETQMRWSKEQPQNQQKSTSLALDHRFGERLFGLLVAAEEGFHRRWVVAMDSEALPPSPGLDVLREFAQIRA